MRGLNLARLAHASEGKFLADRAADRAAAVRAHPPPLRAAAAPSRLPPAPPPTVDVVASIAGHTAYARLAAARPPPPPPHQPPTPLARRLDSPGAGPLPSRPDPNVMLALGQSRLALYHRLRSEAPPAARPLPGAQAHAEGALAAVQAFVVATAAVGATGVAGLLYLYCTPSAVEALRARSVRFRRAVEDGPLGVRLRGASAALRRDGPVLSEEATGRARAFARKAVKAPPPGDD